MRRATSPPTPALAQSTSHYAFGGIAIDFSRGEVTRDGQSVELSSKELQLLQYFVGQRGVTLSRAELLSNVWGYAAVPSTRTVDVHVAYLRRKLEPAPSRPMFIVTVHGTGYKFQG